MKNHLSWLTASVILCIMLICCNLTYAEQSGTDGNIYWEMNSDHILAISGKGNMEKASGRNVEEDYSTANELVDATDSFVYTLDEDGNAVIIRYTGNSSILVVPEQIDGHPVVRIAILAFSNKDEITEVTIPGTIKTIMGNAFEFCSSLKRVKIMEGVEELGGSCFQFCGQLTDVSIPISLNSIGEAVFHECNKLKAVSIDKSHPYLYFHDDVLFTKTDKRLVWYSYSKENTTYEVPDGTKAIDLFAFNNRKVKKVIIPESVEEIGKGVFHGKDLQEVNIPSKIESIDGTFSHCVNLRKVDISPNNSTIKSVGGVIFEDNNKRLVLYPSGRNEKVYEIPYGTEVIGEYAFDSAQFNEVIIPSSVRIIENRAFENTNLHSVELPEGVKELNYTPFGWCKKLTQVILPRSLVTIRGGNPFSACDNLQRVIIADDHPSLVWIGDALVVKEDMRLVSYLNFKQTAITVPIGIKSIDEGAFSNCKDLAEVIVPEGVEKISLEAFPGWPDHIRVVLPDSLQTIEFDAFVDNCTFIVNEGSYAEYYCKSYKLNYEISGNTASSSASHSSANTSVPSATAAPETPIGSGWNSRVLTTDGNSDNRIQNSGFESSNTSMWHVISNADAACEFWTRHEDAHSGNISFHYWWPDEMEIELYQILTDLEPGDYELSVWSQGGDSPNSRIMLYVQFGDRYYFDIIHNTEWQDWHQAMIDSFSTYMYGDEPVKIGVKIFCDANGWGMIDDFSLIRK